MRPREDHGRLGQMTYGEAPGFEVAIHYGRGGHTQVQLVGELDIASLSRLRRVLFALLEETVRVAVDLRELRFVDLPGVRLLIELTAAARGQDCPLEVTGATGQVARLLELTSARQMLAPPAPCACS
jgi:anti-sigma B factor antagonist